MDPTSYPLINRVLKVLGGVPTFSKLPFKITRMCAPLKMPIYREAFPILTLTSVNVVIAMFAFVPVKEVQMHTSSLQSTETWLMPIGNRQTDNGGQYVHLEFKSLFTEAVKWLPLISAEELTKGLVTCYLLLGCSFLSLELHAAVLTNQSSKSLLCG